MESADNSFGPFCHIAGRYVFDFTLLFEDTILSILPSSLILLSAPLRAWQLWFSSRKVKASPLRTMKMILWLVFTMLQVANLVVWSLEPTYQSSASIAALSLSVAVAFGLLALSTLEHSRSIHPSFLINGYLLITVLLDAAKVRTLWLRAGTVAISSIGSISLGVKLLLLAAEAVEKRKLLLPSYDQQPTESTSSLYGRGVFFWLNPVFVLGFKSVLEESDVFQTQDKLTAEALNKRFRVRWEKRKKTANRHQLILTMARCMLGPLAAAVVPRLCQVFFRFMQPLLIRSVTNFVDLPDTLSSTDKGWGLTAAYGLVYMGLAISAAMFNYQAYRTAVMIRGALVTAIYEKTVALSITALDEAAAVTLMSIDVQRLLEAMPWVHELWASPLEIVIAIWLLAGELGVALLGPVVVSVLAVTLVSVVASRVASAQKDWLEGIQIRVSATSKALSTMKSVKMLGLTSVVADVIEKLRKSEVGLSMKSRRLMAYSVLCGNITEIFAPAAAFLIFILVADPNGQQLTVSSAYTILSLISLLANPTKILINFAIPQIMIAIGCYDRIQDYLLSTSRRDDRMLHPTDPQDNLGAKETFHLHENEVKEPPFEMKSLSRRPYGSANTIARAASVRAINCTLSWNDSPRPVINDVSFELYPGLTMLVGKIGCGKTSLMKGLLGEIQSTKGSIFIESKEVAFVDQSPWIYHGTLRENIIGMSVYEHNFYTKVVHACALDEDFSGLKEGDNTQAGSTGSSLSGGQKLRVALARAIYSQLPILILDDVFSGLDPTAEERIFSRLLGKRGFLRSLNRTIVLVTHAAHRLSYADHIIALDEQGSVAEQGSFDDLMAGKGYVSNLAVKHKNEDIDQAPEEPGVSKARATDNERAVAENDLNRQVGDFAVYKHYFAVTGYVYMTVFLVLVALFAFLVQFPALWLTFWTSAISAHGSEVNGSYLGGLFAFNVTALTILACLVFLAYTKMVPRAALRLHDQLLHSVRNAPLFFFTSTATGKIVNRFSQDMNIVDFELPWALVEFSAASCIAIVQAVLICLSAAYFTAIMPVVFAIMYLLQKVYLRTSRQIRLIDLEAKSPLYSNFIETLNGLVTIRALGWTADLEKRNLELLDRSQRPLYMFYCIQRWLNLVLDLMVAGLSVLLMVLIVTLREKLQAGLVGVALLNIMNFNLSLTEVIKQWTTLETSLGAVARVKSFITDTPHEHLPQEDQQPPKSWPDRGLIEFQNVSASYATDGPLILCDINITLQPGQKIGLVGFSGSGKSSLITALLHMLVLRDGNITVDGQPMSTTKREEWRQRFSVIPQEPLFIHGSTRENIDLYSRNIPDEAILSILDKVGLLDTINRVGGLDAPDINVENLFSHGQRQLFSLARTVVNRSHSRILLLDEVTASVDVQTDETMQRIIREEFEPFTIITVAHRLDTILDYDRILVLNQGRIVEDGVPKHLLADKGSRFWKLYSSP